VEASGSTLHTSPKVALSPAGISSGNIFSLMLNNEHRKKIISIYS